MMERAVEIIPTCVPKSAGDIAACVLAVRSFSAQLHIDIDDGRFAPAVTWPYTKAGEYGAFDLVGAEGVSAEIHLMAQDPRMLGVEFARAGAHRVLAHVEAFSDTADALAALDAWRESGAREAGLCVLFQTPFERIDPLVSACDAVHMMSIARIGTQGIPYEPSAPERIARFAERHPGTLISVDGGVSERNIADLARAGARRFGVGAALAKAPDQVAMYQRLLSLAENALS